MRTARSESRSPPSTRSSVLLGSLFGAPRWQFFLLILPLLIGSMASACEDDPSHNQTPDAEVDPFCRPTDRVDRVLARLDPERYAENVARISGAVPVSIDREEVFIRNRRTFLMVVGDPTARGMEWLVQKLGRYYAEERIVLHEYPYPNPLAADNLTALNVAVEIPGEESPDEWVILMAHFDDVGCTGDGLLGPGANDNATGSAALLEAAIALSGERMKKSVRLLWTTGEEAQMKGSQAWVADHPGENVAAVINLDMIGYRPPGNYMMLGSCYPYSAPPEIVLGLAKLESCSHRTLEGLGIADLHVDPTPKCGSDHDAFSAKNYLAVLFMGSFDEYYYHTCEDTVDLIDFNYAFAVTQLAVGMVLALAEMPLEFSTYPPN